MKFLVASLLAATLCTACEPNPEPPAVATAKWQLLFTEQPGAFLSVWGTSKDDVWIVGAADPSAPGSQPAALHWTGKTWQRIAVPAPGADLWWVSGLPKGDVWMSGTKGAIARWKRADGSLVVEKTPGTQTLFGVLPVSDQEVWAVGGDVGCPTVGCPVVWRYDGKQWAPADVPQDLLFKSRQWFKAWRHKGILYIVGTWSDDKAPNAILRYDGKTWTAAPSDVMRTLLTISGNEAASEPALVAVGGSNEGVLTQMAADGTWTKYVPKKKLPMLNGVFVPTKGNPVAVGAGGTLFERKAGVWTERLDLPDVTTDDFHSTWVSPEGEIWAVGGQILTTPAIDGMAVRLGVGEISTKLP
ncbi:MAG: hypothetical protein FJ100_10210 [Deltaproteobacteria bacterium]|nr:hypothetical protein [Deltaproteobacteria bacterium]